MPIRNSTRRSSLGTTAGAPPAATPLDEATATRLVSLARALRAAARAVALYPPEHPAIRSTFARLAESSAWASDQGALSMEVAPETLSVGGRTLARQDPAVTELAGLLHQHLIGRLTVEPEADEPTWRLFLDLVNSPPEKLQSQGGIARVWTTSGGSNLEIDELDYAEILRDKDDSLEATWDRIIANGLKRDVIELDDETLAELAKLASDPGRLTELVQRIETQITRPRDTRAHATVLLRLLNKIMAFVNAHSPERAHAILDNIADSLCRLSDDFLSAVVVSRPDQAPDDAAFVKQIVGRMRPEMVAQLAAQSIAAHRGATARLAEVLRTLVPDTEGRRMVLTLTRAELETLPFSETPDFEELWTRVSELLESHSDEAYVPDSYNEELDTVRAQAGEATRIADDPPERVAIWLRTVSDAALRRLDVQLLIDILHVEVEPERWRDMARLSILYLEDLVLIGDFAAARQLVEALRGQQATALDPYRVSWVIGSIDTLVAEQMLGHLRTHLQSITSDEFDEVRRLGQAVGPSLITPLAEAVASETRPKVRQRLTEMLLTYGPEGRASVDQLMQSSNAGVRRTAVQLLRQFGGDEALPELTALLDDDEIQVRREAVRAILTVGTERAYGVLEGALTSGSPRARDAIMHELATLRDGRATPLFCYIIDHTQYRGATADLYLTAIARLGSAGGPAAVTALTTALYRGDWWAPTRTARLREAAAQSLAKIGIPEAREALREAAENGPRGVRAAARKATA